MIFMTGGAFAERATEFLAQIPDLRLDEPIGIAQMHAAASRVLALEGLAERPS